MDKTPSENQFYAFFKEINHRLKLPTVTNYLGMTSYYSLLIYAVSLCNNVILQCSHFLYSNFNLK